MDPSEHALVIEPEPAGSAVAEAMLDRYYEELGHHIPPSQAPSSAGFQPDAESTIFVAWRDGQPCGIAILRPLGGDDIEVKRMWVHPDHRGGGMGRALLQAVEQAASQRGYRELKLDTHANLHSAIALYHSAGYAEIPPYNDNPDATHWFSKRLEGPGTPGFG